MDGRIIHNHIFTWHDYHYYNLYLTRKENLIEESPFQDRQAAAQSTSCLSYCYSADRYVMYRISYDLCAVFCMETRKNSPHCGPVSWLSLNKQINLNKGSLNRRGVYQIAQIYNVGIVDMDISTQYKTTQNFPAILGLDQKCILKCVCVWHSQGVMGFCRS